MKCRLFRTIFVACLSFLSGVLCAQTNIKLEGMGLLQNRSLKSRLAFLQDLETDHPADLDAALLEDYAFLLLEQLKRDGYLQPAVEALLLDSGETRRVSWTSPYSIQLDADAVTDDVRFVLDPGVMGYYDEVQINGVSGIEPEKLQRYFIPGGVLLQTRRAKVFTPENLNRRIGRVMQSLEAMGYREAEVVRREVEVDTQTGAVKVNLEFVQGPRHYVGALSLLIRKDGAETEKSIEVAPDTLLTKEWEQNERSTFRNEAFVAGYPDVEVHLKRESSRVSEEGGVRTLDLILVANWGEPATLSEVRFEGDEDTRPSTLRSRLSLEKGEPLNRLEVDKARRRLMGLGIYKHVAVDFEPESGTQRDVAYSLEPGVRQELKLLGGWGSYEQARAGFKWEHRNPFGRAHRYEVDAKRSLKSTRGEVGYYIPQPFHTNLLLYTNLEYSFREEITYDRTKQGASFGASYATTEGVQLALEYGYFRESADREDELTFESEEEATVSSLSFSVSYDRRNDFLAPSSGWSIYSEFKIANRWLGGSVDFQKVEMGGSYHFPLTESTIVHLGLRGGTIFTADETEQNIPFNERFFQGGENTLRGYREGEASPLDSSGGQIGAESYALLNFDMEQRVYSNFSAVLFLDSAFSSRDGLSGESEVLHSLGLGLRYKTVVGPVRIEYGHNLNPREQDPNGTLHLSIGFPF